MSAIKMSRWPNTLVPQSVAGGQRGEINSCKFNNYWTTNSQGKKNTYIASFRVNFLYTGHKYACEKTRNDFGATLTPLQHALHWHNRPIEQNGGKRETVWQQPPTWPNLWLQARFVILIETVVSLFFIYACWTVANQVPAKWSAAGTKDFSICAKVSTRPTLCRGMKRKNTEQPHVHHKKKIHKSYP